MERHLKTDEVFVLVKGKATLILGGSQPKVTDLTPIRMNIGEIYNIKKATWHNILVSCDAHLVIVENDDTCVGNSDYCSLPQEFRNTLKDLANGL
jgi:oxalate decarboxylase/phosphoglucose isomerase-like protein (cupin superfamily)